ncbi:MAG: IS1096 element passenger TnpR family protein [Bacteroidota bacterium]
MIPLYRFRISFEDHDDVSRDIDIRSDQTFQEFHDAIHKAIGFDGAKSASFFMSNDLWKKGQEIRSNNSDLSKGTGFKLMDEARLCDFVADPHQKIYYLFDPATQWAFLIELVRILPAGEKGKEYPLCVKSSGEAPKQYPLVDIPKGGVPDPENLEESLFADLLMDGEEDGDDLPSDEQEEEGDESLGEGVDEEEYDDIEESSDEDSERE